jgi:hypothetical protein
LLLLKFGEPVGAADLYVAVRVTKAALVEAVAVILEILLQ